LLLAPFAPHFAEELWGMAGKEFSVFDQPWPVFNPQALEADIVNYGILINGKVRAQMSLPKDTPREDIEKAALQFGRIPDLIKGKTIRKVIVVPDKVVNLVVS
jgi:leucyl-tRNA synthetase